MNYSIHFFRLLIAVAVVICVIPTMAQEETPPKLSDIKSPL